MKDLSRGGFKEVRLLVKAVEGYLVRISKDGNGGWPGWETWLSTSEAEELVEKIQAEKYGKS